MDGRTRWVEALAHFVHSRFIWLLIGSYAVAGLVPGPGLAIRDVAFGSLRIVGGPTRVSLPMLMLAALLFNAGLGVRLTQLRGLARSPGALGAGLAANLVIPIAYIAGISMVMRPWHNPDEVQNVLVGLALIASMPIAGSSTAWSQNADGDLALSLGLVLGSTFLSPITTPLALHAVGFLAAGDYAEDLHELAVDGAGGFLVVSVIVPSLAGIIARLLAGEGRIERLRPRLRLVNALILILLNYSNAAISLPRAIADPDWDFLGVILLITVGLCGLAFAAGRLIAGLLEVDRPRRTALMFGLGMNNNGTGLVLASLMLADHPRVMLPIIVYNLIQHLIAGLVDRLACRPGASPAPIVGPAGARLRGRTTANEGVDPVR